MSMDYPRDEDEEDTENCEDCFMWLPQCKCKEKKNDII